jgi:adenine-specific DNA-methyltransferase
VETNFCITLDCVPEELYPDIAGNAAQRNEWVRLFAIDEITGSRTQPSYSVPLSQEFLKANPSLVLDTGLFGERFKDKLLSSMDDLDERIDGVLVHSENFQALKLLQRRYEGAVRSIYIDPPYNTEGGPILYKNGYRRSSWATLIDNRLDPATDFLRDDGVICVTIDDSQQRELAYLMEAHFGAENMAGTVAIRANPSGRPTLTGFALAHEYAIFARRTGDGAIRRMPRSDAQQERFDAEDADGAFEWRNFRREGSDSARESRPKLFYPIYNVEGRIRVPRMRWNEDAREWVVLEAPTPRETVVLPIDGNGVERRWRWSSDRVRDNISEFAARLGAKSQLQVYYKYRPNAEGAVPTTIWFDAKYSATEHGTRVIKDIFGRNAFSYPKSIFAVQDSLAIAGMVEKDALCLDYFAGSGTTGHAVIEMNRQDEGTRRYVLVEMGEYFESVLKPRIQKVIYSKNWKDGKPASREGSSHVFKYLRLESYEDTLNNLELKRSDTQQDLLDTEPGFRNDYLLHYMLNVETRGSASLLNLEQFEDPFSYELKIGTGSAGETRPVKVDLVETFNYLLGLRVKHIDRIRGIRVVQGTSPEGERVLIIWRNTREVSSADLDAFFRKQDFNIRDAEFDVIYVNGDNNLENLRTSDETWKVRLIEDEFLTRMFDVRDV